VAREATLGAYEDAPLETRSGGVTERLLERECPDTEEGLREWYGLRVQEEPRLDGGVG